MGDASLLVYQMEKGVFFQGNIESFVCEMDLGKCSSCGGRDRRHGRDDTQNQRELCFYSNVRKRREIGSREARRIQKMRKELERERERINGGSRLCGGPHKPAGSACECEPVHRL